METENLTRKWIPLAAGILVFLAFVLSLISALIYGDHHTGNHSMFYLFGINLTLFVIGILLLSFYLFRKWINLIEHSNMVAEESAVYTRQSEHENLITENADAIERRMIEQTRNRTNDLLRLIELSKEKREKSESGIVPDKSDKFLVRIIEMSETIDIEKLEALLKIYTDNITKQPNTENHV